MTATAPDWTGLASSVTYPTDLLIEGRWLPGETRSPVVSPINGQVIAEVEKSLAMGAKEVVLTGINLGPCCVP